MSTEQLGFDNTTAEVNEFNYISVTKETAIQENIFFEDFKVENWEGKEEAYLEVTVRNAQGQTCNRRYSTPKIDGTYVKDAEGLKKANDKMLKICKNITTKVLGDAASIKGKDFKELWINMITAIKAKPGWNKVALRAVFNHDKSGYTKLRAFSPIFELMTVPKDQSGLKLGDYDNFIAKQTPSKESDELSTGSTVAADIF